MEDNNNLLEELKSLSEKLVETESILSAFFNQVPFMLAVASKDGRFIKVNYAWQCELGWSLEELCSNPYKYFIHPDDIDATTEQEQRMDQGLSVKGFQNRYRHKDGTYITIEWNSSPYVTESGITYTSCRIVDKTCFACPLVKK